MYTDPTGHVNNLIGQLWNLITGKKTTTPTKATPAPATPKPTPKPSPKPTPAPVQKPSPVQQKQSNTPAKPATTKGMGNSVTNSSGAYNSQTQTKGNNILNAKVDPNNYNEDDEYDKNYEDGQAMRGSDAKKKEKKEVDDTLGKRGSKKREQQSQDLHDAKNGGRNDDNRSYGDLKKGNYWRADSLMDKVGEITGLTGTALVVYFIISEGSRLFPPRNFIPVP